MFSLKILSNLKYLNMYYRNEQINKKPKKKQIYKFQAPNSAYIF